MRTKRLVMTAAVLVVMGVPLLAAAPPAEAANECSTSAISGGTGTGAAASATLSADGTVCTLQFPGSADGTYGGSKVFYWAAPDGINGFDILAVGGGGGGGITQDEGAGGGGAGGQVSLVADNSIPLNRRVIVTVGDGGRAGGAAGSWSNQGLDGADSYVYNDYSVTYVTAAGGRKGAAGSMRVSGPSAPAGGNYVAAAAPSNLTSHSGGVGSVSPTPFSANVSLREEIAGGGGAGAAAAGQDGDCCDGYVYSKGGNAGSGITSVSQAGTLFSSFSTGNLAGGGGSGSGSTESTSPSTPTTPTVVTTPALQPLGPSDGPAVRNLPPGGSLVTVGGLPTQTSSSSDEKAGTQTTSGDGWQLKVGGRGADGQPQPTTSAGTVQVPQGGGVFVQGSGYAPGTTVVIYALNPAIQLGTLTVGPDGTFRGTLPLPASIAPGSAVIQVNGYAPDMQVRSASFGLRVIADKTGTLQTTSTTVYFAAGSSHLSADAKKALAKTAKSLPKGAEGIRVSSVGYVQGTSDTSNDYTLSTARATVVADQLKKDKLKGTYLISGRGVAKESGAKGRKVVVTITYRL